MTSSSFHRELMMPSQNKGQPKWTRILTFSSVWKLNPGFWSSWLTWIWEQHNRGRESGGKGAHKYGRRESVTWEAGDSDPLSPSPHCSALSNYNTIAVLKYLSLKSKSIFGKQKLSIFLVKIMAIIFIYTEAEGKDKNQISTKWVSDGKNGGGGWGLGNDFSPFPTPCSLPPHHPLQF